MPCGEAAPGLASGAPVAEAGSWVVSVVSSVSWVAGAWASSGLTGAGCAAAGVEGTIPGGGATGAAGVLAAPGASFVAAPWWRRTLAREAIAARRSLLSVSGWARCTASTGSYGSR